MIDLVILQSAAAIVAVADSAATDEDVPVLSTTPVDGALPYSEGIHIGYRAWLRHDAAPAYWFGHGLGTFDPRIYFFLDNQYLGTLVETGLVGTALSGRYVSRTTPELNVLVPTSWRWCVSMRSRNRCLPLPSTTG